MDSARWEHMQQLFHRATELEPHEQPLFLALECGGDATLENDVLALLAEDAQAGSLLDRGLPEAAHAVFESPLARSFLVGREFGPYRLCRLLGEGGMGIVFLAERADLGNRVAVKILRDAHLSSARLARFAAEQHILAQLDHPCIARLYDADTFNDGTPYFVMEYVEGLPLTDYCRVRNCSIPERLELFRNVCEAVQHAHAHALIHRDLKPSNILVKDDGTPRLLDFGIAKQLDASLSAAEQTQTGLRLLTPAYAAPEQIRGGQVGIRTDVYSLGVILYELLAGKPPFDLSTRTPGEAELIIVHQEPPKPSSVARSSNDPGARALSKAHWEDLNVLCLTAMHKDPNRRYQSAEALVRDVNHYGKSEPLEARPDALSYRLGKFLRRNRRQVSLAAAFILVVLGLVIFFVARLANARNQALAEAGRAARIQQFMSNLLEGGDKQAGPSADLRVVTLLDRGREEVAKLKNEPRAQAELLQTLGVSYQNLGKLDIAGTLLQSALDKRRSLPAAQKSEIAESLVALGLLRADQAHLQEGENKLREGLSLYRDALPLSSAAVTSTMTKLGQVLDREGKHAEAIPLLKKAMQLETERHASPEEIGGTITELANADFYLGNYAEAESLNLRALEIDRKLYGPRHPNVSVDLINLGNVEEARGHYGKAEPYLKEALDITRAWYGPVHPETASALTTLGQLYIFQARYGQATELLQQALTIQKHIYGEMHPRYSFVLGELGRVALHQKRLDEAESDFRRVEQIDKTVYNNKHERIAKTESNLAAVLIAKKQYAQAERYTREALAMYAQTVGLHHLDAAVAQGRLGRILLLAHKNNQATEQLSASLDTLTHLKDVPETTVDTVRDLLSDAQKTSSRATLHATITKAAQAAPVQ